jgi:transcriptional regulator with XRE-family HTH domain
MGEWRQRFKDFMREAQVTQDYLAEKMDVSQGTIAHWLKGRREINLSDFLRLCEWAGADAQRILFGARAAPPEEPGMDELHRVLSKYPNLKAKIARPSARNDDVARALGPTPARRAKRQTGKARKVPT